MNHTAPSIHVASSCPWQVLQRKQRERIARRALMKRMVLAMSKTCVVALVAVALSVELERRKSA